MLKLYKCTADKRFMTTLSSPSEAIIISGTNDVKLQSAGTDVLVISGTDATVQNGCTLKTTGTGNIDLPAQFKIATAAVSANVTAANLNTLTAGSSSNADALHTHAAPSGVAQTQFSIKGAGSDLTNSSAETTLLPSSGSISGSLTIPANTFSAGKVARLKLWGTITDGYGQTLTLRVKLGSAVLTFNLVQANPNDIWEVDVDIVCRSTGSSGSFYAIGTCLAFNTNTRYPNSNSVTLDTTSAMTFDFTGQWSGASANNHIILQSGTMQLL